MAQWRCIKESRLAGEAGIVSAFYPPPSRSSPPSRERGRAVLYRREKIYTRREKERETEKAIAELLQLFCLFSPSLPPLFLIILYTYMYLQN